MNEQKILINNKETNINGILISPNVKSDQLIILCHGLGADKQDMRIAAEYFSNNNYNTFIFDFYGTGDSLGKIEDILLSRQITDLENIFNYFKKEYQKIGIYGFSLGATTSLLFAKENKSLKAIVSVSGKISGKNYLPKFEYKGKYIYLCGVKLKEEFILDFKNQELLKEIPKIKSPTLIIHGSGDEVVDFSEAKEIFEKLNCKKEIKEIYGADHLFTNESNFIDVLITSLKWFNSYLR